MTFLGLMLAIVVGAAGLIAVADGWGHRVHKQITENTWDRVKRNKVARHYLVNHLGEMDTIIDASVWADSDDALAKYPGSDDLHFSNTPWRACGPFDLARDCGYQGSGQCIVTGIADMVMIATDPSRSTDERTDALKFVLHLLADIHQPLHTGFMKDSGGCNILLDSEPKMSLHQLWDHGLIEVYKKAASSATGTDYVYDASVVPIPSELSSRDTVMDYASALATESSTMFTCNVAYRDETGEFIVSKKALSPQYMESRKQIARDRITAASHRLAELIVLMAQTFAINKMSKRSVSTVSFTFASINSYETLDIEFEPDELVEKFACTGAINATATVDKKPPEPNRDDEVIISPPDDTILRVGEAVLSDVVLYKAHETYWITCGQLLRNDEKYIPMYTTTFRVRFSRNRNRNEPISFVTDAACFGPIPLDRAQFRKVLYHLSGQSDTPEIGAPVATITRRQRVQPLEFEPIKGEVVECDESYGCPYLRGWAINHQYNPVIRDYLRYLRLKHISELESIHESIGGEDLVLQKWDRDFYSNLASIRQFVIGSMIVWLHTDFFTASHLFQARFTVYIGSNPGSEEPVPLLIDTNIFDGFITPRIHQGIWKLNGKRSLESSDPMVAQRSSFYAEMHDIMVLLTGRNQNRAAAFKAVKGYFMYASTLGPSVAYIEWTTRVVDFNASLDIPEPSRNNATKQVDAVTP